MSRGRWAPEPSVLTVDEALRPCSMIRKKGSSPPKSPRSSVSVIVSCLRSKPPPSRGAAGKVPRRRKWAVSCLGRSVEDFGRESLVLPRGGVDGLKAEVDGWRRAGGAHVSVVTVGLGLGSVDSHIDYLASVAGALGLP